MTELAKTSLCNISVSVFYNAKTRNSFCWRYFGHLVTTDGFKRRIHNPDKVYCSACLYNVKQESGEDIVFGCVKIKQYNKTVSTGNLNRHLRDDHHIQDEYHNEIRDEIPIRDGHSSTSKVKFNFKPRTKKITIAKDQLAKDLALWHCNSLIPFDSVTDEATINFLKKYHVDLPKEDLPSHHTVSDLALTNEYELMLAKVKENIATDGAEHFAMSFDLWMDQCRRLNYVTFKLHYLTSDFVLRAWTLGTKIINGIPTGMKINSALEDIRNTFGLAGNIIGAVTDIGNNLEHFATHHLCIGHSLQNLITVDGIHSVAGIKNIVQKCKEIFTAVRYQGLELQVETLTEQHLYFMNGVDEVVKMLEVDELHPIPRIDVYFDENVDIKPFSAKNIEITQTKVRMIRWQIVLEMLETMVNKCNHSTINNILSMINKDNLCISESEWILLEEMTTFLKGFRDTVEILISITAQNICTLNVVLLFRSELIDLLKLPQGESTNMLCLKHNMLENLTRRLPVTKTLVAAALLDSRFLSLKEIDIFLERHHTTRPAFLSTYIKEKEIMIDNRFPESLAGSSNVQIKCENDVLLQKLSKKHSINANQNDPILQECLRYIAAADPSEPKDGNLLSLWNNKKEVFPHLSALAKAVLCVPATSIPSERMFSAADLAFAAKKSQLSPIKVNKMLFIHENYERCNTGE